MIVGAWAKTIRFGEPRRSFPRDFLAFQHGSEIQEVQARHKFDITLGAMRVADLTAQHLEASADPDQRLAGSCVRLDCQLPSILSKPKQIRDRVLATG